MDLIQRMFAIGAAVLAAPFVFVAPADAVQWMHWPVARAASSQAYITQGFYGDYIGYCCASGTNCRDGCGTHNGYDYGIGTGTPLYAVGPGVVDEVLTTDVRGDYGNAGLYVRIRHDAASIAALGGDTFYSGYLHMSRIDVVVGQAVDTTTQIGLSGASGGVAAHLHLHLARDQNYCSAPVDPGCPTPDYVSGSVIPGFAGAPACQGRCDANVEVMWLAPAAYGGEPYAGCQGLDYAGLCEGAVLKWCENGTPMEVDCAATDRVCAFESDEIGYNCRPCAELGYPSCTDDIYTSCAAGLVTTQECLFGCDPTQGCLPQPQTPMPDAENTASDAGSVQGKPDMETVNDLGLGGDDVSDDEDTDRGSVVAARGCCAVTPSGGTDDSTPLLLLLALVALKQRRR